MGVTEYISKIVRIRENPRPILKCELMKLSVPFVPSMYTYNAFTVAAPKYWHSLPDDLYNMLLLSNVYFIRVLT